MHSVMIKVDLDKLLEQKSTSLVVGNFCSKGFDPCDKVGRILDRAQKKHENVTFVDIDAHSADNLVEEYYKVTAVPTCLFFRDKKVIDRYQGAEDEEIQKLLEKHATGDSEEALVNTGTFRAPYNFSEQYLQGLWNPQTLRGYDPSLLPPKHMLEDIRMQLSVLFSPDTQKQAARCDRKEPVSEPTLILYCPLEGGENVVDATVQAMAERFNADIQMLDLLQFAVDQWSQGWTDVINSKDWVMSAGRGYFWRRTAPEADKLKRLAHQLFSQKSPDSEESKNRRRIIYIRDAGIMATLTPTLYSAILEVVQKALPGSYECTNNQIPTAIILGASPLLTKSSLFQKGSSDESDSNSSADKKSDPWSETDDAQAEREKRNQKQYKSLKDGTLIDHVDSDFSSTDLFANMKEAATSRYRYSRICVTVPTTRNLTRERAVREKVRLCANLLQLRMALRFKVVEQSIGSDDAQEMVRVFKERCQNSILTIDDMRPIYERAIEVATGEATIHDPSIFLTWDALVNAREAQDAIDQERSEWVDNSLPKSEEEEDTADPLVEKVKAMELNSYETELLQRIIKPGQLKTTFDSVHLPDETVDVVRSVVSLPLICPEAFQTGLLKEHNVTGGLFFGPPGTGKTNLARAIAKESGSRMISVKPSDILNKWVGESEKIVSGLFNLARKLKPCIIFMDEIDSLFGSRDANVQSPWRNDLLTQFAQEMDGMYSSDVIVIGTTNRPFDLDDAMLRRLPCRILIDLPDEAAREAILKILLKNEQVGSDVDIKDLAKQTQRYSGSDLKNACVMAAYESAKEMAKVPWATSKPQADTSVSDRSPLTEPLPPSPPDSDNESTTSATEDEPATPVIKESQQGTKPSISKSRIIRKRHFTYALTKVQASTSESQTSFIQLRKWNDQFGSANQKKKVAIDIPRLSSPVVDRLRYLRNSS